MTYLLDVNLLIALFDPRHVNHEAAHRWIESAADFSWATCPLTENGCVRVLSSPAYPTVNTTPNEVCARLGEFCTRDDHVFWPDDISILDSLDDATRGRFTGHGQVTDYYLAALAHEHRGVLATFDGSLWRSLTNIILESAVYVVE